MNFQHSYPLDWPRNRPRTTRPEGSRFGARTVGAAFDEIKREVSRLDGWQLVLSTSLPLRNDGSPRIQDRISDHGAAVYFKLKDKPIVLACDKWRVLAENLWAIAKHIEALRGQERWGVGSVIQAFAGYLALPAPADLRPWWVILGVPVDDNVYPRKIKFTVEQLREYFVKASLLAHPDRGGSDAEMSAVNDAWKAAQAELAGRPSP